MGGGARSCQRLTMSHRLVLGDVREEFVEGFVVFSETLLDKEKMKRTDRVLFLSSPIKDGGKRRTHALLDESIRLHLSDRVLTGDRQVKGSAFVTPSSGASKTHSPAELHLRDTLGLSTWLSI